MGPELTAHRASRSRRQAPETALRPPPADLARRMREFLESADYTEDGLVRIFGSVEPPLPRLRNLPRLLDATREPTPSSLLARWFLVGVRVPERSAREQIPEWFLDACVESGLVLRRGGHFIPAAILVPVGRLLLASDLYQRLESARDVDHVLTINPASRLLMDFTIRRRSRDTLDLCTGCGVQALAAVAHSDRVLATDLNPRAVAYTAFNARLNGSGNVECLSGDAFEPARGRSFDLIICNPPFVLAPSRRYLYRDSAMELDGFCHMLAREAPPHLAEGGCFQMICEWVQREGQSWEEGIAEWFRDPGCDVWVLKKYTQSPSWYALGRIREAPQSGSRSDAATYDEWMRYYRSRGVEAIHGGLVTMRRRSGPNWLRIETLAGDPRGPFGDAVLQAFAAQDFLEAHDADERLLSARLRVSPQARLEQESRRAAGGWQPQSFRLRLAGGLPRAIGLEGDVAEFLAGFDGRRTLRELCQDLARRARLEADRVVPECLSVARRMIAQGFLVPAGAEPEAPANG